MRKDFALCFNEKYVPYACVTLKSIAEHAKDGDDVRVHILSDYISERNKKRLECYCLNNIKQVRVNCEFHIIDSQLDDEILELPPQTLIWTKLAWYRILLPDLLGQDVRRVLYLDCDVYVNDDLDSLFAMDMGKSIAACLDTEAYKDETYERLGYESRYRYVCSGVLLMNLDRWREKRIAEKLLDFARSNAGRIKYPDQDAINVVCKDDKIILPPKYGVIVQFFRFKEFINEHLSEMKELMLSPKIIHFSGYQPWYYFKDKSMHSHLWWKTFRSLRAFPKVYAMYVFYFFFYWLKRLLIAFGFIKPESKYCMLGWYYNHPRIRYDEVMKNINSLKEKVI